MGDGGTEFPYFETMDSRCDVQMRMTYDTLGAKLSRISSFQCLADMAEIIALRSDGGVGHSRNRSHERAALGGLLAADIKNAPS